MVIPQLQERPSAFRPAHEALCLTPSRPSSRCGGGPRSSSADRELGRRGAGPSFLLFEGSLVASLLACLLEGKGHRTAVHSRALRGFTWRPK